MLNAVFGNVNSTLYVLHIVDGRECVHVEAPAGPLVASQLGDRKGKS